MTYKHATVETTSGTGVIVGRFQVPELHKGHRDLIDAALSTCSKVIVFVGRHRNPLILTQNNPLDYWSISQMIKRDYPTPRLTVAPIFDRNNDRHWSHVLDETILLLSPKHSLEGNITLFGSEKGSFLDRYTGRHTIRRIMPRTDASASVIRRTIGERPIDSLDFRRGIIYATQNQKKCVILPTVDIAVYYPETDCFLLCSRKDETRSGFPGGFLEADDESAMLAAEREVKEEVNNIEVEDFRFVTQTRVRDWRDATNTVCYTTLFICKFVMGHVLPTDDLGGGKAEWVSQDSLLAMTESMRQEFVGDHAKLADEVLIWMQNHGEEYRVR